MSSFKTPTFQDRIGSAAKAKKKALEQRRSRPPIDAKVAAERQAKSIEREAKYREKAAAKKAEQQALKDAKAAEAAAKAATAAPPTEAEAKPAATRATPHERHGNSAVCILQSRHQPF